VVNSRDLAERSGKRHTNVLRDINGLRSPELGCANWFREVLYVYGLTRDGYSVVVMGWTGPQEARLIAILGWTQVPWAGSFGDPPSTDWISSTAGISVVASSSRKKAAVVPCRPHGSGDGPSVN
jgi:hypothetical protein